MIMAKDHENYTTTKLNLSVKEMCERLQLSRTRVIRLIADGVFVAPSRDQRSGRPYFGPEAVQRNLEARRTGVGAVSGQPVLFYASRTRTTGKARRAGGGGGAGKRPSPYRELLADLASLDLGTVAEHEVAEAVQALADAGDKAPDTRAVYRQIKRQRSSAGS